MFFSLGASSSTPPRFTAAISESESPKRQDALFAARTGVTFCGGAAGFEGAGALGALVTLGASASTPPSTTMSISICETGSRFELDGTLTGDGAGSGAAAATF